MLEIITLFLKSMQLNDLMKRQIKYHETQKLTMQ